MRPTRADPRAKPPNIRTMCREVNKFLVRASAAGINNPAIRQAAITKVGNSMRVEPIESHRVNPRGDYITLGETKTSYAILHNPRTGQASVRRAGTSVLLPRAVIEDVYTVSQARAAGKRAELKPASRELLLHEGTHARRAITGISRAEGVRLIGTWERDPRQLRNDLEVVFGKKAAHGILKTYPTWQLERILTEVNEERMADEAAIRGEAVRLLQRSGARAITTQKEYMRAVEASARPVLRGRPKPYQRAVLADIAMAEARLRGVRFQQPSGAKPVERLAGKLEQFSSEIVSGFGGIGQYSATELMMGGGPRKVLQRKMAA